MKLSPRKYAVRAVCIGLASVAAGGCVQQDAPSVGIKPLAADIVFGVTPIEEEEAKPAAFEPAAQSEFEQLPPQIFEPPAPKSFPRPPFQAPKAAKPACPDAALDEFPDQVAPQNVPDGVLPKEGIYRWKKSGTQKTAQGSELPIGGFEERAIRNVTLVPNPIDDPRDALNTGAPEAVADQVGPAGMHYTFETVQPSGADRIAITRYLVNTTAPSREVNSTVGEARLSAGDPERGVVIKSVTYTDKTGNAAPGGFTPTTGLLVAPLPVRTGEQFTSVAVDPRTQQVWRYEAQMVKRDRVDACGEIVDGWLVDGTLTVTGDEGGERKFSLMVSPQLGAIPISEHAEGTDANGTQFNLTYSIGQLEPSPFPTTGG